MTLPDVCDFCGHKLTPWDADQDTLCNPKWGGCGNIVPTWEHLTPEQRRMRITLIYRRANPTPVAVRKDVL